MRISKNRRSPLEGNRIRWEPCRRRQSIQSQSQRAVAQTVSNIRSSKQRKPKGKRKYINPARNYVSRAWKRSIDLEGAVAGAPIPDRKRILPRAWRDRQLNRKVNTQRQWIGLLLWLLSGWRWLGYGSWADEFHGTKSLAGCWKTRFGEKYHAISFGKLRVTFGFVPFSTPC